MVAPPPDPKARIDALLTEAASCAADGRIDHAKADLIDVSQRDVHRVGQDAAVAEDFLYLGQLDAAVALLERQVAKITLDGMDADGAVRESAVADVFAGVITDAAVNRRQRVVPHEFTPSTFEVASASSSAL